MTPSYKLIVVGLIFVAALQAAHAESPAIAIIIDDLGHNLRAGERVTSFNWPITCSILPARPYSAHLAKQAHQNGKEIMVHLPMQASKAQRLGHGALTMGMNKREFVQAVNTSIDAIPFASGINNHMGSLLTRHAQHMDLLMQTIANRDDYLYFVDSKTTASTVARQAASDYYIPSLMRDVFLDANAHDEEFVRNQFKRLIEISKQQGYALAIGHPYDTTMSVLDQELSKLSQQDIQLVQVSKLIEMAKIRSWQTYSSLSPKVVKN